MHDRAVPYFTHWLDRNCEVGITTVQGERMENPRATRAPPASPADGHKRELCAGEPYVLKSSSNTEDALKLVVYSPELGGLFGVFLAHLSPFQQAG